MQTPREVLLSFMKSMHDWELRCAERQARCACAELDYAEAKCLGMAEYQEIYNLHCSNKAKPRNYNFTVPPEYHPQQQIILDERQINSKTVEFHTKQEYGFQSEHLFKLVLEEGVWKISCKFLLSDKKMKAYL